MKSLLKLAPPLMDVFRTRKVEFDYSLDDVKLFYASLELQEGSNSVPLVPIVDKVRTSLAFI